MVPRVYPELMILIDDDTQVSTQCMGNMLGGRTGRGKGQVVCMGSMQSPTMSLFVHLGKGGWLHLDRIMLG